MTCRWKDDDGNQRYDCFIPEIDRPGTADFPESQPGEKRQRQPRRPTSKGALFSEYNRLVHEWLTHLRRVHFRNPPLNTGGKVVNATNPLVPKGESLYYVHSKTAYYNSFFFEFWDKCFVKTFGLVCPFYDYESVQDLEDLLAAKVQRYARDPVHPSFNTRQQIVFFVWENCVLIHSIVYYYVLIPRKALFITPYYYFLILFHCRRNDGSDLYLISANLLHIFDQTMSLLPFAV